MKKITFLLITFLFTLAVNGAASEKKITKTLLEKQEVQQAFQQYFAVDNTTNKTEVKLSFIDFFKQLKEGVNTLAKQSNLKSAMDLTHKLDSLVVDRWNEYNGKLEASQLEIWTWHENGLGKSWELYDIDSLTGNWNPNDKEEYTWDNDGNKTLHIDYDPDTINGGWLINAKEIRSFDSNGNGISYLLQFKNRATEEWENNAFNTLTFDANGNITENLRTTWDTINNAWVNSEKEVSAYNEHGNLLRYEVFGWDTTQNNWISNALIRYEYDENGYVSIQELVMEEYFFHSLFEYVNDSNGNELEVISWIWDFMSNSYVQIIKNTHTYSIDGNELSWSHYEWDATNSDWMISWKMNYQYDENGYLIYRDRFYQDNTLDSLIASWKNDYINNTDGNPTLRTSLLWDNTNEIWLNNYREHYDYDSEMRQNYFENQTWDTVANAWLGNYKEIHEYDLSGNFLLNSKQKYDTISEQWLYSFTDDYTYDFDLSFADICYPSAWISGHLSNLKNFKQYHNAILQKVYSEEKNGQLEITERLTFYYSEKSTTSIPEGIEAKLHVFPNPATDYLVFEVESSSTSTLIEIYDLQGRKVIAQELPENHRISVSHLKTGIYVYKLIQGSEVKQGKIIKK